MTNIVAIALFGTCVSPRFDCAPAFRIIELENGEILAAKDISTEKCNVTERIKILGKLNVNILICGGIDGFCVQQLKIHSVKIYSWITGQADDALGSLLKGQLESGFMMAPGGRCCGQWRFHGKRGGGHQRKWQDLPPDNE